MNGDKIYSTEVGDLMVVWVMGEPHTYIAEVIKKEPLRVKITEKGPYANLQEEDFIIYDLGTAMLQTDRKNNTNHYLRSEDDAGRIVLSGLKRFGVNDNRCHCLLPG